MSHIESATPVVKPAEPIAEIAHLRMAAVVTGIMLLAHLPLLIQHAAHMWNRPHYQFFPLVPIGAVVIALSRLRGVTEFSPGSRTWSHALLTVSFCLLLLGVLAGSPLLGAVSFLITLAALIFTLGGIVLSRRLFPAWGLLWLAVPMPLNLDVSLITSLQRFTARAGSEILDIWPFEVLHMMSGTIVEVPGKRLLVEEACSGIHSLFAGLACTVFFVLWIRRPWIRGSLLVVAAVLWVLASNITRVVIITYAFTTWDINLTEGVVHTIFGLVLFTTTLLLIVSTDRLFLFLTPRRFALRSKAAEEAHGIQDEAPLPDLSVLPDLGKTILKGFPVVIAFGSVLALQVWTMGSGAARAGTHDPYLSFKDLELGPDALPTEWGAWQRPEAGYRVERRERSDPNGAFSQSWEFRSGDLVAIVSLDLPFRGWHDLTICYQQIGWTQIDRGFHSEEGRLPFVDVKLSGPEEENGYLLFGLHDETGRAIQPLQSVWNRLGSRLQAGKLWRGSQRFFYSDADAKSFQIQLIIQSDQPLRHSEEVEARQFFQFLRKELSRQWADAKGGKG